jgi:hypothetical protein
MNKMNSSDNSGRAVLVGNQPSSVLLPYKRRIGGTKQYGYGAQIG